MKNSDNPRTQAEKNIANAKSNRTITERNDALASSVQQQSQIRQLVQEKAAAEQEAHNANQQRINMIRQVSRRGFNEAPSEL